MACPKCSRSRRPRNKRPNAAVGWGSSHLSSQSPTWRKRRRERIRQVSLIQYQSRIPVYYNESIYQKRKLSSPNYLFFLPTLHQCQNLPKIVEQPRHCSWSRCFQSIVHALSKHAPKLAMAKGLFNYSDLKLVEKMLQEDSRMRSHALLIDTIEAMSVIESSLIISYNMALVDISWNNAVFGCVVWGAAGSFKYSTKASDETKLILGTMICLQSYGYTNIWMHYIDTFNQAKVHGR